MQITVSTSDDETRKKLLFVFSKRPDGFASSKEGGRGGGLGALNSGLSQLARACRAAAPVQALMLLLLGAASLVPICEPNCMSSVLDTLSFPNGPPPI